MRRWIALLLAVVLTATGCAAPKPQTAPTEALGVVSGRTETDFPGVEIRILGYDPADGAR